MNKKLETFNRYGNTFMIRHGNTYVLCNDSKFRLVDKEAFDERDEVIIDMNSIPYMEKYEEIFQ
jgi:hypothetical protein